MNASINGLEGIFYSTVIQFKSQSPHLRPERLRTSSGFVNNNEEITLRKFSLLFTPLGAVAHL